MSSDYYDWIRARFHCFSACFWSENCFESIVGLVWFDRRIAAWLAGVGRPNVAWTMSELSYWSPRGQPWGWVAWLVYFGKRLILPSWHSHLLWSSDFKCFRYLARAVLRPSSLAGPVAYSMSILIIIQVQLISFSESSESILLYYSSQGKSYIE